MRQGAGKVRTGWMYLDVLLCFVRVLVAALKLELPLEQIPLYICMNNLGEQLYNPTRYYVKLSVMSFNQLLCCTNKNEHS